MHIGAIGTPGWSEILLIFVVALLLFGAKRLPDLARSLGKSLNEFKKGLSEGAKKDEEPRKDAGDQEKDKS